MAGKEQSQINTANRGDLPPPAETDLARLQDFLLEDAPGASVDLLPALNQLSVDQLESLLAQKRREAARQNRSKFRIRQAKGDSPASDSPRLEAVRVVIPERSSLPAVQERSNYRADLVPSNQTNPSLATRFEPARLVSSKDRRRADTSASQTHSFRNWLGYGLETVVIIAALVLCGNWALQQAGISINLGGAEGVRDFSVLPSRAEGIFLSANATGQIVLPGQVPPTVVATTTAAVAPARPTPTPVTGSGAPIAIAPTPTPVIVSPILQSVADGAAPAPSPARRLLIPRLALDTPVVEVTVNLGNWQVADNAAGHHLGTAMPGQAGNMVLAGHRDIRGSVFLKLNELQKGDEFRVVTDRAVYRYLITDINEVAPTEIAVLAPTIDPTATLITCTPIGLATRRLIIKARLDR